MHIFHCWHPRRVKRDFISHSGREWSEYVIEHDDSGFGLQAHSTDDITISEPDCHGWSTLTSRWPTKCCKCGKAKKWEEKNKIKRPVNRQV